MLSEFINPRRLLKKKDMDESKLAHLDDVKKKEIMKVFAEMENRRKMVKTNEAAQRKRENEQMEQEQEKMNEDFRKEKAWAETGRREKRMDHWQDFAKTGKRAKTQASGWKEEQREPSKHGVSEGDQYKKKWK